MAAPPQAQSSALDVLRSCAENGRPIGAFGLGELRQALREMPADLAEYSECDEHIARALRDIARYSRRAAGSSAEGARGDGASDSVAAGSGSGGGSAGRGAGGRSGGSAIAASGRSSGSAGAGARRPGAARGEADEGISGALLSGAEAVGSAPLDLVEAAAEGRLGLPDWLWPLLAVAGLLGVGVWRERRA